MVHSIRLWHHYIILGWFTSSGSASTYIWDGSLHRALTPLNPGITPSGFDAILSWDIVHSIGADATYTRDSLLHPVLSLLNPGMVHSIWLWRHLPGMVHFIRLWRHLNLGWFTPSGSDAIYTWDGSFHPAQTPLIPELVHSILFDATYMGWFTPSGFDAIPLGWFTPSCFDASYMGWFTPFGSGAAYTWDRRPHPALTSLTWCDWPIRLLL